MQPALGCSLRQGAPVLFTDRLSTEAEMPRLTKPPAPAAQITHSGAPDTA